MDFIKIFVASIVVLIGGISDFAAAQEITISQPITIGVGDLTYEGQSIIVDGTTLTIGGDHTFNNIHIKNGGVLTTPVASATFTQAITITATTITVDEGSRIDVSGKGLTADNTAGAYTGGSHAGKGGDYSTYKAGAVYGSYQLPTSFGRGGRDVSTITTANRGGGAIKLVASVLNLEGKILANGDSVTASANLGGGAGGSILLDIGSFISSGSGEVRANGGHAKSNQAGGGGGGGRIGIYYQSKDGLDGAKVSAAGGNYGSTPATHSGTGTVYWKDKTTNTGSLHISGENAAASYASTYLSGVSIDDEITISNATIILSDGVFSKSVKSTNAANAIVLVDGPLTVPDNNLVVDGITLSLAKDHTFNNIHIKNGGVLTTPVASTTLTQAITITATTITVDEGSRIDVSGKGLTADNTAGAYTGGSHAGKGGDYSTYKAGAVYGSYQLPTSFGRGGRDVSTITTANRGGGAIKLVASVLNLEGKILANGDSVTASANLGGGAGGSILLDIGSFISSGSGEVRANGGHAKSNQAGGGGGGGRIGIYYQSKDGLDGAKVSAAGGNYGSTPATHSGTGTVYWKDKTTNTGSLHISGENAAASYASTYLSGVSIDDEITISNATIILSDGVFSKSVKSTNAANAIVLVDGPLTVPDNNLVVDGITLSLAQDHTFNSIHIKNGGVLTTPVASATLTQAITITATTITVDEGSRIDVSGKGQTADNTAGYYTGGSHAGKGGDYSTYKAGAAYGSYQLPTSFGRGGRDVSTITTANRGGGAIKLVASVLNLEGKILANGDSVTASANLGGGAGGSILLDIGSFISSGSGEVRANGGHAKSNQAGGGGGGGRIGIYYQSKDGLDGAKVSAAGGNYGSTPATHGGTGTVYWKNKSDNSVSPLQIFGQGSGVNFAQTVLTNLSNDHEITIENANVLIDGAATTGEITLLNSHAIFTSSVDFFDSINFLNSRLQVTGNANFAYFVTGTNSSSVIVEIGGQLTVPGNNLVVDGITLSLAQNHTFNSIHIKNGGVLTTPVENGTFTQSITITASTITIDEGSRIDVSGKGSKADMTTGDYTGGSHGGRGGDYSSRIAGSTYGSYQEPISFGRGGRTYTTTDHRGGGAIRLKADNLIIDGKILADGGVAPSGSHGGGAGGSIWLDVGALSSPQGKAEIRANGSDGSGVAGGGGGRIAIYYESKTGLDNSKITALGGSGQGGGQAGGTGTAYWKDKTNTQSNILKVQGVGSGTGYAFTQLSGVTDENNISVENANVAINDSQLKAIVSLVHSTLRAVNTVHFTESLNLLSSRLDLQADAYFEHFVTGTNSSSAIVEIGGQLTVPGNNLVVDGITLSLAQNHTFNSIHIKNGGVLTTPAESATYTKGITVKAVTITVDEGSRIDVSGKGSKADITAGNYTGGSHGGKGGDYTGIAGATYGSYQEPISFGRGGRSSATTDHRGGGAIKIEADILTLNGKILANGAVAPAGSHGGGAGGSIWLDVDALTSPQGTGEIRADGSDGRNVAGGGGGRIAIYYSTLDGLLQSNIKSQGGPGNQHGGAGTVYWKDQTGATTYPFVINGNGSSSGYALTTHDNLSSETHIQINNAAVSLKGINPAVKLDLTNSQVTLVDVDTLTGELNAQGSVLNFAGNGVISNTHLGLVNSTINIAGNGQFNRAISLQGGAINVKGNAVFTDTFIGASAATSSIAIDGQLTVPDDNLIIDGITLSLAKDHIFNSIHIKNGGVLTTPAESTTYTKGITVKATTITVDEGSRIDVSGKGSKPDATSGIYTGGSHGGKGGDYVTNLAGTTYGNYQEPTSFGRGGRPHSAGDHRGGGAIKIEADTLTLNGKILADGALAPTGSHSGGAGGSIWLDVGALTSPQGTGEIRANGSNGRDVAGGGGGRIAIYYESKTGLDNSKITAAGGSGTGQAGGSGTVYWKDQTGATTYPFVINGNGSSSGYALTTHDNLSSETHIQINNAAVSLKGINPAVKLDLTNSQVTLVDVDTLTGELNAQGSVLNFAGNGVISNTHLGLVNSTINIAGNGQFNRAISLQGGAINVKGNAVFTDTFIGASAATSSIAIDGQLTVPDDNLIIDGITLSLAKDHIFNSIHIKNGGVLTTPAESTTYTKGITVKATTITVDEGSRIDVSGKGSKPDATSGIYTGGSHGGKGGDYVTNLAGTTYGNYQEPTSFGRGGRPHSAGDHRGGGAIKIEADTLTLNGKILADGALAPTGSHSGGAGGSIWLDVGALTSPQGTGEIRANGSDGRNVAGGGGGRIAIYYEVLAGIAESKITVAGGLGTNNGFAGTLYKQQTEAAPYVYTTSLTSITNHLIEQITVDFSVPIDTSSLAVDDLVVVAENNSTIYPASIVANTDKSFTFVFASPISRGVYLLTVGPNIVSTNGNSLDQNRNKVFDGDLDAYLFDFEIDIDVPVSVIIDQDVAPAINKSTTTQFVISGSRENNTSVWINNAQVIPLGSGAWSHTMTLPQGISNLSVVAKDSASNPSPTVSIIVDVDSIAPTISSTIPSANAYLAVAPEVLRANVSENGSGIDLVSTSVVVKQSGLPISGSLQLNVKQLVWTPASLLQEGSYDVSIQVVDIFGNSSNYNYSFVVDTTVPVATVLDEYPSQTSFNTHTFSGTKEAYAQVLINNQVVVGVNSSTRWSYAKTLAAGFNTLNFTLKDRAGNISAATTANIMYDNLPPGAVPISVLDTGEGRELKISWPLYNEQLNGNDILNYRVYFSSAPFSHIDNAAKIKDVPAGSTSTIINGLATGNTYYFAVVAVDKSDLFLPDVTSVSGQPTDTRAPNEITGLQVSSGLNRLDIRWIPSQDTSGDLASYLLTYIENGETKTITLTKGDVGAANPILYSLTNLQPATAHNLRISVVDQMGNTSTGVTDPAITLLPNPVNLQAESETAGAKLIWNPVSAYSLIKHYAVYVKTEPFTSVDGLAPTKIVSKGSSGQTAINTTLTGLVNGTKVYVAVTAVNNSNGELKEVAPVAVTPQNDTEGPTITSADFVSGANTQALEGSPVLIQAGKFAVKATDKSKISRVIFTLNGDVLGNVLITNAQGAYEQALDLTTLADGAYTLKVDVYDMLENLTQKTYNVTGDLAAPAVPTIVAPAQGTTINQTTITLNGKSVAGTQVAIANNGTDVIANVPVDSSGNYSATIDVQEGDNLLTVKAQYVGRTKWSSYSAERKVIVNTQIPDAPTGVSATAAKQGQIHVTWNTVTSSNANNQVKGYNIYRATSAFTGKGDAGVSKVNSQPVTTNTFSNLVVSDGTYFYAVAAVNQANNEGALSSVVSAVADSIGPKITQLTYTSDGPVDTASGRMGKGRVSVVATFSEPLRNSPYFAIVPEQGLPISIDLAKSYSDEKVYTGQFTIDQSTGSGTAYVSMSAHDNFGNRGTDILQGSSLLIDAQGPDLSQLTIAPVEPLKVDATNGLVVNASIRLSEALKPATQTKLVPLLNGVVVAGYEQGILLNAANDPLVFTGEFSLPNTAAQSAMATLSFAHQAEDDLGNISQKIIGQNQFQVYQGDLPPLDIPADLTATALPNGKVKLRWRAVEKAAAYVLYRQGPSDSELIALEPITAIEFEDQTTVDGTYLYAVASVRRDNDQESQSAKTQTVSVKADRVAPAKPINLALELNGAGIVSRWAAPAVDAEGAPQSQQGLTYNLYRTASPQGQNVGDYSVYTPIQTRIPALIALDTTPSTDEHSYFVTAVDAAGNQSVASDTVYLNFGLLPVSQLHITLDKNSYPVLSWQHKGNGIESYRVLRRLGENAPQLLTPEAIAHTSTTTTYTDTSYNGNQASNGAHQEVVYSVVAVDEFNVESLGHELLLPALSVRLEKTKPILLERGVMNQLLFQVDNKGATAANGLRLFVTLTENGQQRIHQSELFAVAAGANTVVPVVVGGYDKLDAITDLSLRLEQKPQTNQSITIKQSESVEVGSSSLTVDLLTQDFTRGGIGKVTFTITNNSDVETEVVMATNNSKADSTEVRLILEDLQGNLLTQKAIRQTAGGVINVPSGHTVARIPSKDTFTSGELTINVPAAAPDQVRLRLVIDKYHYQLGKENHVAISGVGTSKEVQLSDTPYYAQVTSVEPLTVNAKNGSVTITGKAIDRATNQPLANVPVSIVTVVRGFERTSTVYSDASGNFVLGYKLDGTAGKYRVSAIHPEMTDRPNHGEFTAEGGSVSPADINMKVPRNYVQKIPLRITAGNDTTLTNVRVVQLPGSAQTVAELPAGVTITHSPLATVNASTSKDVVLNFTGDNSAAETGSVAYRVEADNHTGVNALGYVNIIYTLSASSPAVATKPAYIDAGVGLEQTVYEDLVVSNKGLDLLRNAQVELVGSQTTSNVPSWVSLATASSLGDIPVGEARAVQLAINPGSDAAEGTYELKLQISGDNLTAYTLPVFIKVTQSGKGSMAFKITDIYTATRNESNNLIQGVHGARIQLQNENVLSEVYNLNTDVNGDVIFQNIPAGRYAYRVSASDHTSVSGRAWVKPGVSSFEKVFLMNNIVNVEWSVREITVEDRYEIKLEATFKTHVPVALVMLQPLHVQLPVMRKGEVFQGEFTLTNHGLIRADNVKQRLPASTDMVRFEFLKEVPSALAAGQVFTLPYRIHALRDFNPASDAFATGGGCGSFSAATSVAYTSECAEGTEVPGSASAGWSTNWGSCGGSGGSAGTTYIHSHGGGGGGGGWGWSGGGTPISGEPQKCDSENPNDDNCDNGNGGP